MGTPYTETIDLGEYIILIDYDGDGGLEVSVLDELEDTIEGIYISNDLDIEGDDDNINNIDPNLN